MIDPITLLLSLAPLISLTTIRQFSHICQAMLAMTGRVTMLGMSRWTDTGGSYRTIQRFFATVLPWDDLFLTFFCAYIFDPTDVYGLNGDGTVASKAGTKTHGLDRFFSSLAGKPIPGVEFFTLSLVSTKLRRSFPIRMIQMFHSRDTADQTPHPAPAPTDAPATPSEDATPVPPAASPKRKPGRPRKDATATPTEASPKRKPGRPRKDATAATPTEASPKRKPGRPRKDAIATPTDAAPKRKPGRPRKDATATPTDAAPKRKPGRPRKDATAIPTEAAPKRKPGRPRKDATPTPSQETTKRKPGRPKGSKTGRRTALALSPELERIGTMVGELLLRIAGRIPLTYLVLDGHFGNAPALQMTRQHGLHLISKLRHDAALYLPYTGSYAGRGPRRKYGDKVTMANLPEHCLCSTTEEKKIITKTYQMKVWNKQFPEQLNVVIIAKTNTTNDKRAHVILFSSDMNLAADKLIDQYALRFQLEFNFRDAKQFWGLEDFMNIHPTQVTNAANLSLFMVNLSYCLLQPFREHDPEFSLLDLKAHYRGMKYIQETIKMLPENPEPSLLKRIIARITGIGRIHPAEPDAAAA